MISSHTKLRPRPTAMALAIALVVACSPARPSARPLADDEVDAYRTGCQSDDECMLASNGCCACGNATPQVAVLRSRAADFSRAFRCEAVECPMAAAHVCDALYARCVAGRCSVESRSP